MAIRSRKDGDVGSMTPAEFVDLIVEKISSKAID